MYGWILLISLLLSTAQSGNNLQCPELTFDWTVTAVSRTTTTLQVVANPLLDPHISPVANTAWESLANLQADYVRYVPWFPYPKVGVAELQPPSNGKTFWDFDAINVQLEPFMNATLGQNHTAIPNFSTQPTWMFNTTDWSYPSDPNKVDWGYPRGGLYPNTTATVAAYYGRLLSWMINGQFTDEFGVVHTGGHNYNITHWEIFNEVEAEHSLSVAAYTKMYDAIVKEVRRVADPQKKIQFVGLALAFAGTDYISYFLNNANHDPAALPLNFISFHFYASCSNRTDPDGYMQFFAQADNFVQHASDIQQIRQQLNPNVKIDMDEIGCILPDDNDNNFTPFPRVYWNACGAFYAYIWANLVPLGFEVLGQSQLAGVPATPAWGIQDAQYPSVSLLNWTTGRGNARYWILKLLLENFGPGDKFLNTQTSDNGSNSVLCPEITWGVTGTLKMWCNDPTAVINNIQFAGYGTIKGTCGNYMHDPNCDAKNVTQYVVQNCVGKNSCQVTSYPTFGDPCYGTEKRLVVQATCSGTGGGSWTPQSSSGIFAQSIMAKKSGSLKILLINRDNGGNCLQIPGATGNSISIIDEFVGDNPARVERLDSDYVALAPFAVAVIHMEL